MQRLATFLFSLCLLYGSGYLIYFTRLHSAGLSALTISSLNIITPRVVKQIQKLQYFRDQSSYEASQFITVTFIRWMNTTIVTQVFSPFADTLENGSFLINSVFATFITEMFLRPILANLNHTSNIKMHILGPRAVDQRRMNLNFQGGYTNISERYTVSLFFKPNDFMLFLSILHDHSFLSNKGIF